MSNKKHNLILNTVQVTILTKETYYGSFREIIKSRSLYFTNMLANFDIFYKKSEHREHACYTYFIKPFTFTCSKNILLLLKKCILKLLKLICIYNNYRINIIMYEIMQK